MKKNKINQGMKRKIASTLAIPEDILCDVPRFTVNDNREIQIENHKGILSYEENEISLGAKGYKIIIQGKKLKITVITDEYMIINGTINALMFN